MKNSELEIIKEKYKSEFKNTAIYEEAVKKIYMLQQVSIVQEYLNAYKIISCNNEEFKKTALYNDALKKVCEFETTNVVKDFLTALNIISMASVPRNYSKADEYYTQLEVLNKILDSVDLSGSSKIYLCCGTYKFQRYNDELINEVQVERENLSATHKVYRNIETGKYLKLAISNCENFENVNIVIYPEGKLIDIDRYYEMIRNLYITKCISNGIASATEEICLRR